MHKYLLCILVRYPPLFWVTNPWNNWCLKSAGKQVLCVCLLDATFKVWTDGFLPRKIDQMSAALVFCQFALCGSQFWQVYILNLCLPPSSKACIIVDSKSNGWGPGSCLEPCQCQESCKSCIQYPGSLKLLKCLVFL